MPHLHYPTCMTLQVCVHHKICVYPPMYKMKVVHLPCQFKVTCVLQLPYHTEEFIPIVILCILN